GIGRGSSVVATRHGRCLSRRRAPSRSDGHPRHAVRRQDVHGRGRKGPLRETTLERLRLRRGGALPRSTRGLHRARDPVRLATAWGDAHRLPRRHAQDAARPLRHPVERHARPLRHVTLVVTAETRARATLARSWGILPLAWDSHRHVRLMPPVARVVGRVARDEGVRWIRRARAPRTWSGPKQSALRAATFVSALAFRGIPGNRCYVDITSERPRLDAAGVALLAASGGVRAVGAHPV